MCLPRRLASWLAGMVCQYFSYASPAWGSIKPPYFETWLGLTPWPSVTTLDHHGEGYVPVKMRRLAWGSDTVHAGSRPETHHTSHKDMSHPRDWGVRA